MLIQQRQLNESLMIGKKGDVLEGPIEIKVVMTGKNRIRLGVIAPKKLVVYRPESQVLPAVDDDQKQQADIEEDKVVRCLGSRL